MAGKKSGKITRSMLEDMVNECLERKLNRENTLSEVLRHMKNASKGTNALNEDAQQPNQEVDVHKLTGDCVMFANYINQHKGVCLDPEVYKKNRFQNFSAVDMYKQGYIARFKGAAFVNYSTIVVASNAASFIDKVKKVDTAKTYTFDGAWHVLIMNDGCVCGWNHVLKAWKTAEANGVKDRDLQKIYNQYKSLK